MGELGDLGDLGERESRGGERRDEAREIIYFFYHPEGGQHCPKKRGEEFEEIYRRETVLFLFDFVLLFFIIVPYLNCV